MLQLEVVLRRHLNLGTDVKKCYELKPHLLRKSSFATKFVFLYKFQVQYAKKKYDTCNVLFALKFQSVATKLSCICNKHKFSFLRRLNAIQRHSFASNVKSMMLL